MTEVVREVTKYGFKQMGLRRIYANVFPHNKASMRVLEKAGYRMERTDVAGYLASTLFPEARRERRAAVALSLAFQRAAGRIPGLRRLGANYTILARPSA